MTFEKTCFKSAGLDKATCSLPKDHAGIVHVAFPAHTASFGVMLVFEIPEPIAPRILYPISK